MSQDVLPVEKSAGTGLVPLPVYNPPLTAGETIDPWSAARGLNDAGSIVGYGASRIYGNPIPGRSSYYCGMIWDQSTVDPLGPVAISALTGPQGSEELQNPGDLVLVAEEVNNSGIIVGDTNHTPTGTRRAFVANGGVPVLLPKTQPNVSAWDINDGASIPGGQTILYGGQGEMGVLPSDPTMWVQTAGGWKDKYLGRYNATTGRNDYVAGYAGWINDRLEMTGWFQDGADTETGQLWRNGRVRNLNETLLPRDWLLTAPAHINNKGVVLGRAVKIHGSGASPNNKPVALATVQFLVPELDAAGNEVPDPATGHSKLVVAKKLRVAKMQHSLAVTLGSLGVPPTATLNPDLDRDRFYVKIRDKTYRGKAPKVRLWTTHPMAENAAYQDNPALNENWLTMDDDPDDPIAVISKALLLTSDDVDDDFPVDAVPDDALNDRTRKTYLGGLVHVEYLAQKTVATGKADHSIPVPEDCWTTINIVNLAGSGATVADIKTDVLKMRERYAQVALRVRYTITPTPVSLPTDVDLVPSGFDEYEFPSAPTLEERALLSSALVTPSIVDVQSFYVNYLNYLSSGRGSRGEAFLDSLLPLDLRGRGENAVVSFNTRGPFTLAHEVGHVITNRKDHEGNVPNLMRNGTSPNPQLGEDAIESIAWSKRLSREQQRLIYNDPAVLH